ncbi:helix-turn-helix domain-containing protein [Salinibacterium sp. NG22]|uniref:PucR family transcriptional regulator n=1 Tax=Salinibacterium sp. NG22 TaxID=2792040 RepID=UPI0018CF8B2E|nr:helix-turn-helix domain-containing protein [Salinibacterium sp. NG22]MBH0110763.1 helix-turn-helix domain-containing protein [Salinibacterium sp. NG22]
MAFDVLSLTRLLGGTLKNADRRATTPIDSVILARDLTVHAHPQFVTAIVVTSGELAALLRSDDPRTDAVRAGVLIVDTSPAGAAGADGIVVKRLIEDSGVMAILCPPRSRSAVLTEIAAALAVDQAAEDRLVTSGTKVLTQVARRGGVKAVMAELAHRIDGWAVLLDSQGHAIASSGAGALHVRDAAAVALNQPVRVRHPGLQLHPVGASEDLTAYLVVASRAGAMSRIRDLSSHGAALLDLLLRTHDNTTADRLGRDVMITSLLTGQSADPRTLLRRWGVHDDRLTAFVLSSRSKSVDLERLVTRWFDELGWMHVMTLENGAVLGFIRDDRVDAVAARIMDYAREVNVPLRCGFGTSSPIEHLEQSASEARQAHQVALADGQVHVQYEALPTVRFVLDQLDSDAQANLARTLNGLRENDGQHGELTRTLRVYLAENGSLGITATQLVIHRQTLSSRLRQIEDRTGLSMENPDDRTAAWLALRALER